MFFFACSVEKPNQINYRGKNISASDYEMSYESGNWEHPDYSKAFESLGNQRIVVEVGEQTDGPVQIKIPWRRKDDNPQDKTIIIIDANTNIPIENIQVLEINNEFGHLVFEPNKRSSKYYVYYLPHQSTGSYYPKLHYLKPLELSNESITLKNKLTSDQIQRLPKAKIISAQSIDDFNSFLPMEIIATKEEVSDFIQNDPGLFYLFPEYRERPIKMDDYLPLHWIKPLKKVNGLSDKVLRGEFYTFQIGVFAASENLKNIIVQFTDLKSGKNTIPKEMITCFNTSGIDLNGVPFNRILNISSGKIQALWFGIDIPESTRQGEYLGHIIVKPVGPRSDTVIIKLKVLNEVIANHGDDSPENMTRLRWLNSSIGTDPDFIVKPFEAVKIDDKTIRIIGRDITLNDYGLPEKISSFFTQEMTKLKDDKEDVLAKPIRFEIINKDGRPELWDTSPYTIDQTYPGEANWESINTSKNFRMKLTGSVEYDGMLDYKIQVTAINDANIKDIKLEIPMQKDAAQYILGLGFKGGKREENIAWKWDVKKHQEGVWLGTINKGLQYVLRDEKYERPLNTNFYQTKPLILPTSWYNENKGGINISSNNESVNIENYCGSRTMLAGDTLNFNIRFLITPFKLIDTKEHFSTRFVHKYVPVDSVAKWKGTIVNVHHANEINPYINYPFYNVEQQKAYINEAHSKGIKVKLYNTIRELSYKSYELFALKSLGDEIFNDGQGGGHSWLQEHFKSHYFSAWHATTVNDAAILNKGNSRWTNYYIEGINWLAKNQKIDGLYLDDIAFSRTTVKRIASVLNAHRENFVIDLHSANQYNFRDGFINSALLYMEHMPYISRLWFGEYFEYNLNPDYWLTEVSGIPFGLTGEMLEGGGHPFRGLVYGMTNRVYGDSDPRAIWKLFDDFDIANSEMLGYWVDRSPVKTNHQNIKSTVYLEKDKVLIAIGSWSDKDENVILNIDWRKLGFNNNNVHLFSPKIEGLQDEKSYDIDKAILVEKNKGLILILNSN